LIVVAFLLVLFLSAFGAWRQNRWGYLGGAIMSIIVILFFGDPTDLFRNPANQEFAIGITFYAAAIAGIPYGIFAFRRAKRPTTLPRKIPRSSMLGLIALGFLFGALIVGFFAGGTQAKLLSAAGGQADITIVQNAATLTNGLSFTPPTFTVKAGSTVTWINRDSTTHTVTSTTGLFDSGNLGSGDTFKFTFSQPGTYQYYCTIHPNMKGTIVATA
jgi:plastocyanin